MDEKKQNHVYILKPGVEVYQLSHREYLLQYGFAPRYSILVKDDSKNIVSRSVFAELKQSREIKPDEIVSTASEPERAQEILDELRKHGLLIPETSLYRSTQLLPPAGKVRLGLVGSGLAGYLALEVIARYRNVVEQIAFHLNPKGGSHPDLKSIFPYIEGEYISAGPLVQQFGLSNVVDADSPNEVIEASELVLAAYSDFNVFALMELDELFARGERPWTFALALGDIALAGPLIHPGETASFREFFEYARISGLMRMIEGDRLVAIQGMDSFLVSPYHLAAQAIPIAVYESLRFALTHESWLKGSVYIYDGGRGLITAGRVMRIPGYTSHQATHAQDLPVIPTQLQEVLR